MNQELRRKASRLYQESIIYSLFGHIRINDRYVFDDHIGPLVYSPLGMFFYNQRAIFFGFGLLFLLTLFFLLLLLPMTQEMWLTTWFLAGFWLIGVVTTLLLHGSLTKSLKDWVVSPGRNESPPILDRYFVLDFFLVLALIVLGRLLWFRVDGFAFLLFANTVVWGAYIGGGRRSFRLLPLALLLIVLIVSLLLFLGTRIEIGEPRLFYGVLFLGPLVGMSSITVFSVVMIAMLRATEHRVTQRQLELLGKYEDMLSTASVSEHLVGGGKGQEQFSELGFDRQANKVLEDLCTLGEPFWYDRTCLWFIENHQDKGEVAIPGARYKFAEAEKYMGGVDPSKVFVNFSDLVISHPMKYRAEDYQNVEYEFQPSRNAPVAFIPLRRVHKKRGVLVLYGRDVAPPIPRQEEAFLRSLGSIISNSMEQWAGRYASFPQGEMDDLFKCRTLEEVFPLAAGILRRYLMAAGCMVVFRPGAKDGEMNIAAYEGFSKIISNNHYVVGRGQTGQCAESGELIRIDDVEKHLSKFDVAHFSNLVRAHGKPVASWMAIPIGGRGENHGVIKVVNSEFRCSWFTEYDEKLGKDLAIRLHVLIEKFLQIKETEEASAESKKQAQLAQQNAKEAIEAKYRAESAARQRQQDLLTITHQLQGPLIPVVGTLSGLLQSSVPKNVKEKLEHAQALVEDAFTLCYGTFTTFALEAEQKPAFVTENVDAPTELRKLSERLKKTNSRSDLRFRYKEAPDFPTLRIDRNIFTSVLYSLVHNAMKYASEDSEITLECGFEGPPRKAVLKVKSSGERILPSEKDAIFRKFGRGQAVARGRHHNGVGLGLWVARELMRYVGGDLTVELTPHDPELSVFIVHIPPS